MKIYFETKVNSSIEKIKLGFNRDLFLRLKPPFVHLELKRFDGCERGNEVHLELGLPGLSQSWLSRITESYSGPDHWTFVDEGSQLPFPLKNWRHEHRVQKLSETSSAIIDSIEYSCGNPIWDRLMFGPLWLSFCVRPRIYQNIFGKA